MWDHAAPFTNESKPLNVLHRDGACGTMLHYLRQRACHIYGRASLWNHAASREQATLLKRIPLHPPWKRSLLGSGIMLLHPLLSLVLLISYRDARITSNRESMNLLPENNMKTFSQITRILSLWPACEAARHGREGRRDARK